MMSDETLDLESSSFVAVAMRHGLLQRHHADKILDHARRENVQPSDAALTLSLLELYEVDAIQLLSRPSELAPGYKLIGLIGCGAGGMVFRARQSALGRDVALKTINLQSKSASFTGESRIQREAHAIARLQHPNIVAAYDSGFHQGRFCIAMELVEGETLASFIHRDSPIEEAIVWRIVGQVAHALSHANQAGIIHRDIKPANLLLTDAPAGMELPPGVPFVKVADFGLALANDDREANQLTVDGATLGTPAYVAPEQLQDTHVDARADIYALGATAFHMLTGRVPCADRSPIKTIMAKTIGDDRWRDDLPATVSSASNELFRAMTELDLDQRVQTYEALIDRVNQIVSDRPVASGLTRTVEPSPNEITQLAPIDSEHPPDNSLRSETPGDPNRAASENPNGSETVSSRKRLMAFVIAGATCLIAGLGFLQFRDRTDRVASDATVPWQMVGSPNPLFNGQSVPLFIKSGSWSPGIATDGSRVLVGGSGSHMTIPLSQRNSDAINMRLRFGVLPEQTGTIAIEIQTHDARSPSGTVQIVSDLATFISADQPDRPRRTLPLTVSTPESVIFQRVQISRQDELVLVEVNGQQIGMIQCDPEKPTSVTLRAVRGDARFGDIDMVRLSQVATQ